MPVKKDGVARIMWDYNNTYFTFPLLLANGGYAFVKKDGVYDGKDTGVNNDGAVQGAEMLKKLIDRRRDAYGRRLRRHGRRDGQGRSRHGHQRAVVVGRVQDLGHQLRRRPAPSIGGKPSKPFIGVIAFAINAASPNKDLAVELIENYILTDEGLNAWDANKTPRRPRRHLGRRAAVGRSQHRDHPRQRRDRHPDAVQPRDGCLLVGHGPGARQHHQRAPRSRRPRSTTPPSASSASND